MKTNEMRCLHVAYAISPTQGVAQQMEWESKAVKELNIKWEVQLYVPILSGIGYSLLISVFGKIGRWLLVRVNFYLWLLEKEKNYDVILLRYVTADIFQYFYVLFTKKSVYFVHHSLELSELRRSKKLVDKYFKYWLERWLGKLALARSRGSIGVTAEIYNHEISRGAKNYPLTLVFPNGVNAQENIKLLDERNDVIHIAFIASIFYDWHGLDLLLDSVSKYDKRFVLHLVGTLNDCDKIRANSDSRIIVHKTLNKTEIDQVMAMCSVGLGSFALYRKDMNDACTLKVRDYFTHGLAVYSGHKDIFPDDFNYYKFGPPDINDIISYAESMMTISRMDVFKASVPYINKMQIVQALYNNILRVENNEY